MSIFTIYSQLNLPPLKPKLTLNRLTRYEPGKRSDKWINRCTYLEVDGRNKKGRTCEIWRVTVAEDLH